MHNVTFNKILFYDLKILNLINQLNQQLKEILEVIKMLETLRLSNNKLINNSDDKKELNIKRNQNKQYK